MKLWECKVDLKGIPTVLTTHADNYLQAKGYFLTFGKLLNEPRIISE
jgi:hypothetical protein